MAGQYIGMKTYAPLSALALVLALLVPAVTVAQPPLPPPGGHGWEGPPGWGQPPPREVMEERMRQWRERSPEQRELIRERFGEFRRLNPEMQQRMQERFREFQAMPESERSELRERFREFQTRPEAERGERRGGFRPFRRQRNDLPPATGEGVN